MKKLYFVGIGGAGMAPLAAIALERGIAVVGSDRELNAKTAALSASGAVIYAGHRAEQLPEDADRLIYSSAVPPDNPERQRARDLGIPEIRRGEFLGLLTGHYPRTVAVSGAHGKTSITALLVHILRSCGRDPGYLIGGMVPGLPSGHAGDGEVFITEADESDGTHTALHPWLGVVPNADDDHAWSVGGEAALRENFHRFARQCGRLLYFQDRVPPGWFTGHPAATAFATADADAAFPGLIGFQRRNAFLAAEAAVRLGVERAAAREAAAGFPGVARRMTVRRSEAALTVVEDYAHHPAEVNASLEFLRAKYPNWHIRVLFQPHRYARLQKYLEPLAAALRQADSVMVAPVFAAWSETGPIGGAELAARIGATAVYREGTWAELAAELLADRPRNPLLVAVIGAGDVERILPFLCG